MIFSRFLEFWSFNNPNTAWVVLGSIILGFSAGMVGTFPYLKKRALIGDALAHAALPGITSAFLIFHEKSLLVLLPGAIISCLLGYLAIDYLVNNTKIKEDSALAIVLSIFFAIGIFQLVQIQKLPEASKAGLDSFLFGKAAALVSNDLYILILTALIISSFSIIFYRALRHTTFDPLHATAIGLNTRFYELSLAITVVLAVSIGMQLVGVVLMAAILLIPPASARYWNNNLIIILFLSGLFGAVSGLLGAMVSFLAPQMPTGPWTVIFCSFIFIVSVLFSKQRGILYRFFKQRKFERRIDEENILRSLYLLTNEEWDNIKPVESNLILKHRHIPLKRFEKTCQRLEESNAILRVGSNLILTKKGFELAKKLTRIHRLWELYLIKNTELDHEHVHFDADKIEHFITKELADQLLTELDLAEIDPHGKRIPTKD